MWVSSEYGNTTGGGGGNGGGVASCSLSLPDLNKHTRSCNIYHTCFVWPMTSFSVYFISAAPLFF